MKSTEFGFTVPRIFEIMGDHLEHGEWKDEVLGSDRAHAMREIQTWLTSSYQFGQNPLARLKECFPRYEWEAYRDISPEEAAEIMRADFVWFVMEDTVVAATDKRRKSPLSFLFVDREDHDYPRECQALNQLLYSGKFNEVGSDVHDSWDGTRTFV